MTHLCPEGTPISLNSLARFTMGNTTALNFLLMVKAESTQSIGRPALLGLMLWTQRKSQYKNLKRKLHGLLRQLLMV